MSEEKVLDPKRGLVVKLCEIMQAVGYLQKKGKNESQKYSYVREADVVEAMREQFSQRNIFIFPSLVHHENVKMTRVEYDKVKESYQTNVVMRWTIVDGDSGQERTCEIPGSSASPGDKGVYVAMTGSEKYLLMKSFLLPTGDDPEQDENEPIGSKEAAKAVGNAKVAELKSKAKPSDQDLVPALQASIAQQEAKKLNLPPVPSPTPTPAPDADLLEEMSGSIQQVRDMQTSPAKGSKSYRRIAIATFLGGEIIDREITAWDNFVLSDGKLFDFLTPEANGQTATLLVEKVEKAGKVYWNLKDVKQIGERYWENRLGFAQRNAHA